VAGWRNNKQPPTIIIRQETTNKHKEELVACVRDLQQETMHMIDASSYSFRGAAQQCSTSLLINMNEVVVQ
jgi:hypothetical protein